MEDKFSISGNIVDVVNERIYKGRVEIKDGRILRIIEGNNEEEQYIVPGLIDAHIHIESSMLIPSEFARIAVTHGTVSTVSDPHEIANVLGIAGVKFMINNGNKTPFKFYFGAPSCVPATGFETSGSSIGLEETEELLKLDEIKYLSEMMNYPGVIYDDKLVLDKISLAKKYHKPIDGHSPGLEGENAIKYIQAGITTDHECYSVEEARFKILHGMKILIREGSAAKNFDTLFSLIEDYPDKVMLCSDDLHPNDLKKGHINLLISRAVRNGISPMKVIKSCTYNPVKHYNLNVGLLQQGDNADFIIVDNLKVFNIISTYINGQKVAENGKTMLKSVKEEAINNFNCKKICLEDIQVKVSNQLSADSCFINVIEVIDGQLLTKSLKTTAKIVDDKIISDTDRDILKIIVYNRYEPSKPAIGFVKNFGLKEGAICSTIAHDSHNIICVGATDEDIVNAINLLIDRKGGLVYSIKNIKKILELPLGGIMNNIDGYKFIEDYEGFIKEVSKSVLKNIKLKEPFMTLSFLALLVIPELKLSDKGLFDGVKFNFTNLIS